MTNITKDVLKILHKEFEANTPAGESHHLLFFPDSVTEWCGGHRDTNSMQEFVSTLLGIEGGLDKDVTSIAFYYSKELINCTVYYGNSYNVTYTYEENDDE